MVGYIAVNTAYSFEEIGNMSLPQIRLLHRMLAERFRQQCLAASGLGLLGAGIARKQYLTEEQLRQLVQMRKQQLGKEKLSLEEVFCNR